MMKPGDERAATAGGRGRLRASHADREQVIDALKAAFVQGQIDKDELGARVGHAFASRTYAELAALTTDIPVGPAASRPTRRAARAQARPRVHTSIKTGVCAIVAATMLEALSLGATWPITMLAIFVALVFGVIVAGIVALPIAAVLMLESRHRKRSGRQLPPRPTPGTGGQALRRRYLMPQPNSSRRSITVSSTPPKRPEEIWPTRSCPDRGRWIDGALAGAVTQSAMSATDPAPARAGRG